MDKLLRNFLCDSVNQNDHMRWYDIGCNEENVLMLDANYDGDLEWWKPQILHQQIESEDYSQ